MMMNFSESLGAGHEGKSSPLARRIDRGARRATRQGQGNQPSGSKGELQPYRTRGWQDSENRGQDEGSGRIFDVDLCDLSLDISSPRYDGEIRYNRGKRDDGKIIWDIRERKYEIWQKDRMASKSHSWRHSTSIRLLAMNRMIYPRRNEREEEEEEEEKEGEAGTRRQILPF